MVDWSVTAGKPEKLYTRHLLPKGSHIVANTKFEAAKRQAKEEITAFYNERVTKLTKMLDDANKLTDKFADDPGALTPIWSETTREKYVPLRAVRTIKKDIRSLVRFLEKDIKRLVDEVDYSRESFDLRVAKTYGRGQVKSYDWDVNNLEEPLKAFQGGYEAGIAAYTQSRKEWVERYG